ncbi:hypothetical protein [Brevundimonas sp.]|uniref:hypothetical protein n=1 Tax=Brevundimonas sp. TaxID=1871086 RepID=UPI0025E8A662|nr:hypothetical protein [Brevundimonas sp.]
MTENNQTNQDQDRLRPQQDQGRQAQPSDVGSSLGVQGEDRSFGTEGRAEDERSQGTSATLSPNQGGTVGQGGGVDNADFAASGGTREQNLGRSDQAGTGATPEGGVQKDRG